MTPLRLACDSGHEDMVKLLLKSGASTETKSKNGYTPLHSACQHGLRGMSRLLIDSGADIEARTVDQKTPLAIARANRHDRIVSMLEEALDHKFRKERYP